MKKILSAILTLAMIIVYVPSLVFAGTDDYPSEYKNAAKDSLVDAWNFYNRECTSFVAWRLNSRNGVAFTNWYGGVHWGNADNWGAAARSLGITVDNTPAVGAVAWWSSMHVAWVEAVDGNNVTIEEYNNPSGSGNYKERTILASNPTGYIHIKDMEQTPSQINWPDVVAGTASTNTTISWSAATNATDYDVYIYKQGASSYYHFGNTTSTSYSVVLPAGTYEVEVVACNKSNGSNLYAGNAHRTTFTVTEAVPSQINWPDVVAGTSDTNTVISWSAATNATDYDVYIYVRGSASYYHCGNTKSTNYSVVLPAATYEVEVVACNKSNGSNVYAGNAHRTTFTVTEATTNPTATPVPTSTPKPTENPETPVTDGATVKVSSVTASAGNTVNVTVDLSDNKGFANLGIQVGYDANALMLTSVTNNASIGATYTPAQSITANPYNMCWDSTSNITYNGNLATFTFTVKESAVEGNYPITISYYTGIKGDYTDGEDVNYDADFNSLNLNYVNGSITVSSHVAGDINGDGKVNNQDGTYLLRYLAGWAIDIDSSALDVNGDGKVNNQDGTVLLRYLAGWTIDIH